MADRITSDRITVQLTERAAGDLYGLGVMLGLSKTDIVNRAVSLYWFVEGERANGKQLAFYDPAREEFQLVEIDGEALPGVSK